MHRTGSSRSYQEVAASSASTPVGKSARSRLSMLHLHKTQLCRFHAKGYCRDGSSCRFAHGEEELKVMPDLSKTSLCAAFMAGSCALRSEDCSFAHGRAELRRVIPNDHGRQSTTAATSAGSSTDTPVQGEVEGHLSSVPVDADMRQTDTAQAGSAERGQRRAAPLSEAEEASRTPRGSGGSSTGSVAAEPGYSSASWWGPHDRVGGFSGDPDSGSEKGSQVDVGSITSGFFGLGSGPASSAQIGPAESPHDATASEASASDDTWGSASETGGSTANSTLWFDSEADTAASSSASSEAEEREPARGRLVWMPMPAFIWQRRLFIGDEVEVLMQAMPDHYDD